jgi:hypothetical protein
MPWTAPTVDRTDPPFIADERRCLESWLDYHRQTLLTKCQGLDADQLRRRACEPSTLSLLGLVRHLTEVERSWFRRRLGGQSDLEWVYCTDTSPDGDFGDVDLADPEADFATYAREIELVRATVARYALDDTFHHAHHDVDIDLRWVYVHLIEEYARHNGHADLLRQRIDGATGE